MLSNCGFYNVTNVVYRVFKNFMIGLIPKENFLHGNVWSDKEHKGFLGFLTKQMSRETADWTDAGRVGIRQLGSHIGMELLI